MITTEQIKAARALLRWDQPELARQAGLGVATIRRIEAVPGASRGSEGSLDAIRAALERGGIRFIAPNRFGGEGVRRSAGS